MYICTHERGKKNRNKMNQENAKNKTQNGF